MSHILVVDNRHKALIVAISLYSMVLLVIGCLVLFFVLLFVKKKASKLICHTRVITVWLQ